MNALGKLLLMIIIAILIITGFFYLLNSAFPDDDNATSSTQQRTITQNISSSERTPTTPPSVKPLNSEQAYESTGDETPTDNEQPIVIDCDQAVNLLNQLIQLRTSGKPKAEASKLINENRELTAEQVESFTKTSNDLWSSSIDQLKNSHQRVEAFRRECQKLIQAQ